MVWARPRALGWQMTTVQERWEVWHRGAHHCSSLVLNAVDASSWHKRLLLGAGSPAAWCACLGRGVGAAGSLCSVNLKADLSSYVRGCSAG